MRLSPSPPPDYDQQYLEFLGISDFDMPAVIAAIYTYQNHDHSGDTDPVKILMSSLQAIGLQTHLVSVLDVAMGGRIGE